MTIQRKNYAILIKKGHIDSNPNTIFAKVDYLKQLRRERLPLSYVWMVELFENTVREEAEMFLRKWKESMADSGEDVTSYDPIILEV